VGDGCRLDVILSEKKQHISLCLVLRPDFKSVEERNMFLCCIGVETEGCEKDQLLH